MNRGLDGLQPYPFEKLARLFADIDPGEKSVIPLTIGEPQHEPPSAVIQLLKAHAQDVARYPATAGNPELRAVIAQWLERRFTLPCIDPDKQVLPLNGTREGLFAVAQAVVTYGTPGAVISPNPFYQIYEGAALLAGTQPIWVNCDEDTDFLPDFDAITSEQWQVCELLYLCTPGNPAGAVMRGATKLIQLAEEHDFLIASECYSEIYPNEAAPQPGCCRLRPICGMTIIVIAAFTASPNAQICLA